MGRPVAVVTGAAGFLGRALLRALAPQRCDLLLLTRTGRASRAALAARDAGFADERVGVREVTWSDPDSVRAALADSTIDRVWHLAGRRPMGFDAASLSESVRANFEPTAALVGALLERPPGRFVFAGSAEVYGSQPAPFAEDLALAPATPYAAAKAAAEAVGLAAARGAGLPFTVARMAVVYGPDQEPHMFVPQLVGAAVRGEPFDMSPGEQVRDLVYVDDAAAALVALGDAGNVPPGIYNVGSGEGVALRDLAGLVSRLVLEITGISPGIRMGARPYRPGEIMDYRLDVGRIAQATGWRAGTSLEQGLRYTIIAAHTRATLSSQG